MADGVLHGQAEIDAGETSPVKPCDGQSWFFCHIKTPGVVQLVATKK